MASPTVIVFGPTGAVGSAAARKAGELGAKVILAMRDTAKSIPGLDSEKEKAGSFTRVSADLTQPESVRNAITSTGAKHAFIYLALGSKDNMKESIEALKAAGIELVVFLSSFTVPADPKSVQPQEAIPYIHAQVELNLNAIFGAEGYVALRPGSFSSNNSQYKNGLEKGEVTIYKPDGKIDNIVPEDIGRVGGTVLAKGVPSDGNRTIYLFGPKLLTQKETLQILAKVLDKSPKFKEADKDEAYKMYTEERGVPPPLAKYMVDRQGMWTSDDGNTIFGYKVSERDLGNVERYSGGKATAFEEWAQQNKALFV